jgi:hypothetical protein
MSSYCMKPGIRFNDCIFSEPVPLANWIPPGCGGIVAVLAHDPNWAPRPFRALYFGEFGNDSARIAGGNHLFVSVLPMPFSTSAQRRVFRDELISGYNPSCQASSDIGKLFERQTVGPEPVAPRRPIGFMPQLTPASETGS